MLPRVVPSSRRALPDGTSSHTTGVYDPKAFLPHAALLRRPLGRCARFLHAKPRRAVDHISVPLWPSVLSDRLPVVASVGRYPTDKLIGRGPLQIRPPLRENFPYGTRAVKVCGISHPFGWVSPRSGQVTHVLRTRPPLTIRRSPVRLALVRHAASVYPEPGSNSPHNHSLPAHRAEEFVLQ